MSARGGDVHVLAVPYAGRDRRGWPTVRVAGGAITACDPGYDPDGRVGLTAIDVALALVESSASALRA